MLLDIFKLCDATFSPKFAWCRHVLPLFSGPAQLFVTCVRGESLGMRLVVRHAVTKAQFLTCVWLQLKVTT